MNILTLAEALATRYSAAQVTPPTGFRNITKATATPPNAIPNTPFIVVAYQEGQHTLQTTQELSSELNFNIDFHYAKAEADVVRESRALHLWLGVLVLQLFTGGLTLGLAPTVLKALPVASEIIPLPYAGSVFDGIRIGVRVWTREAVAVAP